MAGPQRTKMTKIDYYTIIPKNARKNGLRINKKSQKLKKYCNIL